MNKVIYLEKEELQKIQEMNSAFTKMKIQLGELELNKQSILFTCNELKTSFAVQEAELVKKYGVNSVINIQTGEVTQKEQ